jgi:hypothetical protein
VSSLESILAAALEPHPELVAAMNPTPRQVAEAMTVFGVLSDPAARFFQPAVSAERGV